MRFVFDKPACQNIRRALRKEWLLTNGLGEYASGTVPGCNTRKYHGLLVANLAEPAGRYVLLSTLEESVLAGGREFFFSCRKHPGCYYPKGHEYLEYMETGDWPLFRYRIGPLVVTREIVMVRGKTILLIRYTVDCIDVEEGEEVPPLSLRIKPLLAFRNTHDLTRANMNLQVNTYPVGGAAPGFFIRPYNVLPPLYMQVAGAPSIFYPGPDWCYNVDYFMEEERGYPSQEDLFMPGQFDIPLKAGASILLSASTAELTDDLEELWQGEIRRRSSLTRSSATLSGHLRRECARFLVHEADSPLREHGTAVVTAGYHWFDVWGRDSFISLPGLTFVQDRLSKGQELFITAGCQMKNGVFPNQFRGGGRAASFNSVDASLWYVWAVQEMLRWAPEMEEFAYVECWPHIKAIINAYKLGVFAEDGMPLVRMDEEGLLHSGNAGSQFTWMDAQVNGRPVTPRHGCAVEVNALWYNALSFSDELADIWGETEWRCPDMLHRMREAFRRRFWVERGDGYLADVWNNGVQDISVRPNQIFAVSLPNAPLLPEDWGPVVECVRNNLLTPYGLRTLSPRSPAYRGRCEGGPADRDAAYHQGTVWPWLLGAYGDALLKTAWDVHSAATDLLDTLTPLFTTHLTEAGLGCLSEIFNGNPPHTAGGCIAQAWSVAECCRLLKRLERAAPESYAAWEKKVAILLHNSPQEED